VLGSPSIDLDMSLEEAIHYQRRVRWDSRSWRFPEMVVGRESLGIVDSEVGHGWSVSQGGEPYSDSM